MTAVLDHFSANAASYDGRSLGFPWSLVRRRERAAVARFLGDLTGLRALDLGCGAGYYTRVLLELGASSVHAVDFAEPMVASIPCAPGNRVVPVVADAASFALGQRFDRIVAAGVLEFVSDVRAVLVNARAHATDAATMVVLVPTDDLAGRLYARYHARHGIRVDRSFAADVPRSLRGTGWSARRSARVLPMALVLELVAS